MTQSRVNIIEPLPISYLQRIRNVDGVNEVAYYGYFGGYYQEPRNQINTGAVNIEAFLDIYPELGVAPEQREAMTRTRNGALVGRDLMNRFGWSIGDVVPLGSTIWTERGGTNTWDFEIVGIVEPQATQMPTTNIYLNYDYFDEARTFGRGTVAVYMFSIDDVVRGPEIARNVDELFANSTNETQTQNERQWTQSQISQIGDINFFVNAIAGAVLFTLLFLTGNTMMQSFRERTPELAVLKTYGFSNTAVVSLVFAESLLLCLVAAVLGLGVAAVVFPGVFRAMGIFAIPLPLSVVAVGCGFAALLAIVSAMQPAWRAQRLNIVDALAGR
jgi:putative ABC transport system permease protein